jgi:amidase
MPTTGGALAFEGFVPPYEATLVQSLRGAGAVIIAKTGMTELANWMAGAPTPMPSGYNPISGYGMNPYDPRRDPRERSDDGRPALSPGGSSSGIGTTANFWAANVGTETSGSLLSPATMTMLVAIKPTVGRISRYGIIPLTLDQDTAGPIARTVADAATLLGAIENVESDPNDPVKTCAAPPFRDYTRFLDRDALKGARIGIPRAFYYEPIAPPGLPLRYGGLDRTIPRDGGGDRRAQTARRCHGSSGHSERRRPGPVPEFAALAGVSRRGRREGHGCRLLGRLQIWDEARLQQMARKPRAHRAREDVD